jgi:hypothetical protein
LSTAKVKVFIAWSGDQSKKCAKLLSEFLKAVVPDSNAWVSTHGIHPGANWLKTLLEEIRSSTCGILCFTPSNLNSPWVLFEAGMIAKHYRSKHLLIPYLLDENIELQYPLKTFQAANISEEGTWEMVQSIDKCLTKDLRRENLEDEFNKLWPTFHAAIKAIMQEAIELPSCDTVPNCIVAKSGEGKWSSEFINEVRRFILIPMRT